MEQSPLRSALGRFAPHLRGTGLADVAPDLLAGFAIAALAIPQAVAYALVAGLPAEMGLAAAGVPHTPGGITQALQYLAGS